MGKQRAGRQGDGLGSCPSRCQAGGSWGQRLPRPQTGITGRIGRRCQTTTQPGSEQPWAWATCSCPSASKPCSAARSWLGSGTEHPHQLILSHREMSKGHPRSQTLPP